MSRRVKRDDEGAALILALVFITVVAVAVVALLTLADTSLRSTIAMRAQAENSAAADAAAQIAIDSLRRGSYVGPGTCFPGSSTLEIPNVYTPASGPADSANVACEQDTTTSVPSIVTTRPGYALLTLGTSANEDGIYLKANGNGGIRTQGDVGSRSTVNVDHGQLLVGGNLRAAGSCAGTITILTPPGGTKTCGTTAPVDPGYAPPAAPGGAGTISACAAIMTFQPGTYTNLTTLTNAMNCNKVKVFDFRPGIYYFSYSGVWMIDDGVLVAGAPAAITNQNTSVPGACPSQTNTITPNLAAGVTFVFGGTAQLNITSNANVEICGRYSSTSPPIAIYGLKSALGSVPAQNGCAVATTGTKCAFLETDNQSSNIKLYIHGATYAPNGWVDLDLRKSTNQYFNDGLIVRAFSLFAPASAVPPDPLAATPVGVPGPARTVVVLTVSVCPAASTCPAGSGTVRLRVKVGVNDPASRPTPGAREITVYSWGLQR